MAKEFDAWSERKKRLDNRKTAVYAWPKEIWWCSLGINIGSETNGKNKLFERPVIILKVHNAESLLVLPLTSRIKADQFHYEVRAGSRLAYAKLTQVRTISTKRLLRKMGSISPDEFEGLWEAWKKSL